MNARSVFLLAFVSACGATAAPEPSRGPRVEAASAVDSSARAASPPPPPAASAPNAAARKPPETGRKRLTIPEARRFMLSLINRDRASVNLPPVELDEGAATAAGQAHAEDMARNGYLGHWGSDGSVPEQRHTEAGGDDMVLENALCFTDQAKRRLDPGALIDPAALEKGEAMFFNEVPPNDGHRKNILKPFHKKVGIGIAQPFPTETELAVPCFSQEFTDAYGTGASLPKHLKVGATLHVEGSVVAPATFAGVGLARIDAPKPIPTAELNTRRSYAIPQPYQMYWPPGFKTPIPVVVSGNHFTIDVPVTDGGRPGLYEVSVWGKVPGSPDFVMLSLRTLRVD